MRTNIYIRKENEEAWQKLENRSEWVNENLSDEYNAKPAQPVKIPYTLDVSTGEKAYGAPITSRNKDMEFCKHDAVKGLCKKGCR